MRFHGVMILRDEADIIEQNLTHLLTWADGIYILDLGSTDGTWDLVQDFAKRDKRIVPFKRTPYIFSDVLRGYVFDQYRDRIDQGDWVLRVDGDEFYHLTPPQFVEQRLGALETVIWLQWYYFRLGQAEVKAYESGDMNVLEDRKRPIEDRRRFYKVSQYSEPRMFRYRRGMRWPHTASFPYHAGFVARERIPIRHYPHRDPLQMEARFRLRNHMMSLKAHNGGPGHWNLGDWHDETVNENGVAASSVGNLRGLSAATGHDTGELLYWTPGTPLPEVGIYSHIAKPAQRLAQRIVHPALLPILDPTHPSFDRNYELAQIPAQMQAELEASSIAQSR